MAAIVGHFVTLVNCDVLDFVDGFRLAPQDGQRCGDVGRFRGIRKFHVVAVNHITDQFSPHFCPSALNVEFADEIGLRHRLRNIHQFDTDAFLLSVVD